MKTPRILFAAVTALATIAPALALDRALPTSSLKGNGDVRLTEGVKIGRYQAGKFISQPDAIQIQGGGSTGDASTLSTALPDGVARTHAARASDRISILDYGGAADFNGTVGTDNLAAWGKAALTGKCILFPAGRYFFSATPPIVKDKTLCVQGEGLEVSVITFGPAATDGFSADLSDFTKQVHVSEITIATQGNEKGAALKAAWSDADATINSNQRRLTLRNVLFRGDGNQSYGWKTGGSFKNAQDFFIDGFTFVGRQTNNSAKMVDTLYADDALVFNAGNYGILAGHITSLHVYSVKNCINLDSSDKSIEGLNVSQFDCVGVNRGIKFTPGLASPGFVAANGHINAYIGGICGKLAADGNISNILIYKSPNTTGVTTYCVDLDKSDFLTISNLTCKNQAPNAPDAGGMIGIHLSNSNYGHLNNNVFVSPSIGVHLTGASSENFGKGNITAGSVKGAVTSAVVDSSGSNTIGTGNRVVFAANKSRSVTTSIGSGVAVSPTIGAYAGQQFRVTATLSVVNGPAAGEFLNSLKATVGFSATGVFQSSAGQLVERRAIAASAAQSSTITGIFTVKTSGELQFTQFGQTTGAQGSVAPGDAQISIEQL